MSDRIAIGIIRKAHGVRGEASVEPWTDSLERFFDVDQVTLVSPDNDAEREFAIESVRLHAGRALIKFAGIDAPEDLRTLQNWSVEIPEGDARKLDEGEYFLHQLVGLRVVDAAGDERGTVTDAFEGGSGILLTVKRGAHSFDMPFAADICRDIDLANGRIVAEIPEGLEDLEAVVSIEDETRAAEQHSSREAEKQRSREAEKQRR